MSESIEDTAPVEEVKKEEPVDKDGEASPDAAEEQVKHMLEEVNRERIENKITARDNAAAGSSPPPQQEDEAATATADDGEKPSPRNIRKNALMERSLKYRRVLDEDDQIDMDIVRALAFQGVPDMEGLRSIYWKLLLGYLPPNKKEWPESLKQSRDLYDTWKEELILDPSKFGKQVKQGDHPLSTEDTSSWNRFFKDNELDFELEKDVKRTFPHYHFFNGEVERKKHYNAIKRILFIYAKLNPGIGYVQGMNEILGPLYYIMTTDCDPEWKEFAEADAFFCFTSLMSEIRDNFCKTLDKSEMGVRGTMAKLNELLKRKHPELWQNLEDKQMDPQFYSFRWLTLLLSQEFELPDIFRLWDSFFADPNRFEFMSYFCCAMLVAVADDLLRGSFADNLKLLQHYPTTLDIGMLLNIAAELRDADLVEQARQQPQQSAAGSPAPTTQPQPPATGGDTGARGSSIMGGMTRTWTRLAWGFPYMGSRTNSGGSGDEKSS